VLSNVEQVIRTSLVTTKVGRLLPTREDWRRSRGPIARGSGLGFLLGLVPGGGPITAAFMSYAVEKRLSRTPEQFGRGAIEGVAGPESANNAAVGGSMVPVMSLGIPGTPVTAILLGALVIQGIQPGPMFIKTQPDLFWGIVASMYVGNVFLLILNLPLIGIWIRILKVPYRYLFPIVLLLSVVGAYSANKNAFDIWVMLGCGVAGWLLRKLQYDLAPLIIAFILAPMLEQSLRQSLSMSSGGMRIFLERPIALGICVVSAVLVGLILFKPRKTVFTQGDS
jgi:putative tricarboxylic transport membrane protein